MGSAPTRLERLRDVERGVRGVRWLGAVFAVAQIGFVYEPPGDVAIPFPRIPVALAIAAVLVGLNLLSRVIDRRGDVRAMRVAGWFQVAADLGVVIAVVALFAFDTESRLWPLHVLAILEGAMREHVVGAVVTAVAGVVAGALVSAGQQDLSELVSTSAFQFGILIILAVTTGGLARRFEEARRVAEDQADRLRELAELARELPVQDSADEVLARLVDAVCTLTGVATCEVHTRDTDGWSQRAGRGDTDGTSLLDALVLGASGAPTETIVADRDDVSALAVPIVVRGEPLGVIILARGAGERPFSRDDRDLVQLLAGHAGVAIETARAIEELRALDAVKDEFFHILAHEIRGPITALTGYADLLKRRWGELDDARRVEFLDAVERGSQRIAKLLRDVEEVSEADRRSLAVLAQPFDLLPLVEQVATEELRGHDAHRLELDLPADPVVVDADPDRVTQVLANLVSNAVKYSPDGGRVRVAVTADGAAATVAVTDDGFGVPRHLQPHLFQKFSRLPTPERVAGTGLGLYLSRILVEAMGGTIGVESEEGRGSTFRFSLPLPGEGPQVLDVAGADRDRTLPRP